MINHTNISIIGVAEGEERERGREHIEDIEDIISENYANLGK